MVVTSDGVDKFGISFTKQMGCIRKRKNVAFCYGADKTRGVRIHLQAFINRHGSTVVTVSLTVT